MGIRFSLQAANWLSYVLEDDGAIPSFNPGEQVEAVKGLASQFEGNYFSTETRSQEFANLLRFAATIETSSQAHDVLLELRRFFRWRYWTALLLAPPEPNTVYFQRDFLSEVIAQANPIDGLILQPDAPDDRFSLVEVFPHFRLAMNEMTRWPGMLIWTRAGDSAFFPLPTDPKAGIEATKWLLTLASRFVRFDVQELLRSYLNSFKPPAGKRLVILQLSDVHAGSREAVLRLPRVRQLITSTASDFEGDALLPVISGDLMDSPNNKNAREAAGLLDHLSGIGTFESQVVLGNHDVRKNGLLGEEYKNVIGLGDCGPRIQWIDEFKIGVIYFNSVAAGHLARGLIGEEQFISLANKLDRSKEKKGYSLVSVLHHHPIAVDKPEWYASPFYERLLGSYFTKTDELVDAERFVDFTESRKIVAVMHGHKHIPRISFTSKSRVPILGCGSSVGKVPVKDCGIYLSMNIFIFDPATRVVSCRLLAERIPGGGLHETRRHEVAYRGRF